MYDPPMSSAPPIDLSAIPESQRAAVLALLQENGALKEANRRLEHLVAELNHVVHGKRSEKLSDNDRQLAFEDLETAVAETETRKEQAVPSTTTPRRTRQRNLGHLPADLTRIERVADHLPFYRQSQILARSGIQVDRSTLADWAGTAAFHLGPVADWLAEHLKGSTKRNRCSDHTLAA